MRLFIAEKPSLARAIADVLPEPRSAATATSSAAPTSSPGAPATSSSWPTPDAYDPDFKQWRLEHLPIAPSEWKLAVKTPDLLKTIKSPPPRASTSSSTPATRTAKASCSSTRSSYFLGYRGPSIASSSPTSTRPPSARRSAPFSPTPSSSRLYDAALGRQRADWLYGINMTRLYTVLGRSARLRGGMLSVGRVQTPLLGLIVRRDLEIEKFVPKPYFSIVADVAGAAQPFTAIWRPGPDADDALDDEGRLLSADFAARVERKTSGQPGPVTKASRDKKAEAAPLPYSLADLQIDAGRRLGLSPKAILDVCQALYETHRLTTYPRSDCSYLPEGHLAQAAEVVRAIASVDPQLGRVGGAARPLAPLARLERRQGHRSPRDHPDAPIVAAQPLSNDERERLQPRRPPLPRAVLSAVRVLPARGRAHRRWRAFHRQGPAADRCRLETALRFSLPTGTIQTRRTPTAASSEDDLDPESPIPPLQPGQAFGSQRRRTVEKKTKPPKRFTAAELWCRR